MNDIRRMYRVWPTTLIYTKRCVLTRYCVVYKLLKILVNRNSIIPSCVHKYLLVVFVTILVYLQDYADFFFIELSTANCFLYIYIYKRTFFVFILICCRRTKKKKYTFRNNIFIFFVIRKNNNY